jgi:hypothetical protein
MEAVVVSQQPDGRWRAFRAVVEVRQMLSPTRGYADSSAEAHLKFLEKDAERTAQGKQSGRS